MNALGQNPGAPAFGGAPSLLGGLPPKRPEGQSPATSSLIGGGTSNAWGAPLAAGRDAGMSAGGMAQPGMPGAAGPSHSQLIPGSPALPSLHSGNAESFGSLLAKKAPPSPMAGQTGIAGGMEDETAFAPAGATPRLSGSDPRGAGRRLSTRKPKRGSNLMMFALAVVFLLGFLAVAGWLLRDQVTVLVNRFIPGRVPTGTSHAGVEIPSLPTKPDSGKPSSDSIPVKDSLPPPETAATADKDQVATSTPESAKPAFDPTEPEPRKAMPATPDEVAAATTNAPSSTFPTPSDLPAVPAPPPSTAGGLVEVPPKAVIASLNNGTTAPSNTENLMPSSDKGLQIKASPEAQPAGEALRQFLMAGSLEERLKYTLAADEMQPLMERYYTHNSAGSIPVDLVGLVRFDPKPQVGAGAHAVFGVESKTWQYPVPVMLEETSSGFKVDWLSFVEFKDRMLEKFFQGYQEGPARFHVGIKRYHHFDDGIPNSDDKHSFEVTPAPPNPFKASVFVDKDSNLGLELVDKIPWGTGVWAIVELQWMKKGDREWVELAAVPQTNWYSVPATAPKAAPAPPEKEVPKPPRARPAGR